VFKTNFSEQNKICGTQKYLGVIVLELPPRVCGPAGQNRRQKIFHWGPSCLCRGEDILKIHI